MFVVSSCLLGNNCKYNGGNNYCEEVAEFCRNHAVVLVCPETAGGLKSPRPPAEHQHVIQQDGSVEIHVINNMGDDLTDNFVGGAKISLEYVLNRCAELGEEIEGAILKANSPSCGSEQIYDGTFTRTLVPGEGIFAKMLKEMGVSVMSEKNFKEQI